MSTRAAVLFAGHKATRGKRPALLASAAIAALCFGASPALADCNTSATGVISCPTGTTVNGTDLDAVAPLTNDNHFIFDTGVAVLGAVQLNAFVDGWGLWFEQAAVAPTTISVVNNGHVTTGELTHALEGQGNGGLLIYGGTGSASSTTTTFGFSGVALFNVNGGDIQAGADIVSFTGDFSGGDGFYAGVRAGTPDIVGNIHIYADAGSFTSIADGGISLFADGRTGSGVAFIQTTGGSTVAGLTTNTGIDAHSGSGASTVITDANIGTALAHLGVGIRVATDTGAADVNLTENGGTIFADTYGVHVGTGGTGNVTANISGGTQIFASNFPADGLFSEATTGTTTIGLSGANTLITSDRYGLDLASTSGDIGVTIGSGASLRGGAGAIAVFTTSSATTIDNSGTVNQELTRFGTAMVQFGGSVHLNNHVGGAIYGAISLNGTTGPNVFVNDALWNTAGVSSFGSGADTITNSATGTMQFDSCPGGCAISFAGAGLDTLNNAGTMLLGVAGTDSTTFAFSTNVANQVFNTGTMHVSGTAAFTHLATFNNTGLLDMRTAAAAGNSNADRVSVSGNFAGGGTLGVDVFLGGAGSTADLLHVGGNVSGTTAIRVVDSNSGLGGFTGPGGIALVTVAGTASDDAFALSPLSTVSGGSYRTMNGVGVLQKGFFDYYLTQPTAGTFALVSAPDEVAVQAPVALIGAQNIWYETALKAENRTTSNGGMGAWITGLGAWTKRSDDAVLTVGGTPVVYNLNNKQDLTGVLAGLDTTFTGVGSQGGWIKLGAMAGYVSSDLKFDTSGIAGVAPTRFRYTGTLLGGTITWRDGAWFFDGLGKVDLLKLNINRLPNGTGGFTSGSVDATTWGGMGTIGYHWSTGGGVFLEPILTLAGTSTEIDTLALPAVASTIAFRKENTFRGAVGARIGGVLAQSNASALVGSLTGRIWDQFSGRTVHAALLSSGTPLGLTDDFDGTFGEVDGKLEWKDQSSGLSLYAQGGVTFNSTFTSPSAEVGIRWAW